MVQSCTAFSGTTGTVSREHLVPECPIPVEGPHQSCYAQKLNRNYWMLYATIANFRDDDLTAEQLVRPLPARAPLCAY